MREFQTLFDSRGLRENPAKCKVYFEGVLDQEQQKILTTIGFAAGTLPFEYL